MLEEAEAGCHLCIVGTKLDVVQVAVLVRSRLHQYFTLQIRRLCQTCAGTRAVKTDEVAALAAKHQADVFETSAKQVLHQEHLLRTLLLYFRFL